MTDAQIKALSTAFQKMFTFGQKSPMSKSDMQELMAPVFEEMKEAELPEEVLISYDHVIAEQYHSTIIYGDSKIVEDYKKSLN